MLIPINEEPGSSVKRPNPLGAPRLVGIPQQASRQRVYGCTSNAAVCDEVSYVPETCCQLHGL